MHKDLSAYYRLLMMTHRRFLIADEAWRAAQADMHAIFPAHQMPFSGTIGAPGSRMRRLHDARTDALLRLETAHEKFTRAKARSAHRRAPKFEVFLLTVQ